MIGCADADRAGALFARGATDDSGTARLQLQTRLATQASARPRASARVRPFFTIHLSALLSLPFCQGNEPFLCCVVRSGTRMRMRSFPFALLLCALASIASAEPPASQPAPLSAEQRAIFLGTQEDAPAAELGGTTDLLKGKHYVTSNENAVQRFEPQIRGLRGGYVGVGTDQSYLF